MIYLKKNGIVECGCGTIMSFATEVIQKVFPILDYSIILRFNDTYFTVNKDDTLVSIIEKWRKAQSNQ